MTKSIEITMNQKFERRVWQNALLKIVFPYQILPLFMLAIKMQQMKS